MALMFANKSDSMTAKTPILFLTAKDASIDKIKGLKTGGDDYMTKPFNLEELLLRIINLLKRSSKVPAEDKFHAYEFGGNTINFVTYEAKGINGDVKLTNKELKLLKLLIDRKNEVVSRTLILQTVWGYDVYPSTRTSTILFLLLENILKKTRRIQLTFMQLGELGTSSPTNKLTVI
jgi:two-component system alkaline phosphatase synthesis response regulator PhoP